MSVGFCTLAIHEPYRKRARALVASAPDVPWVVLTDAPEAFADLGIRTVRHQPTGPMAVDYLRRLPATGDHRGAAAYHDKRFAIAATLREFDCAIFVDADSRLSERPDASTVPAGLSVLPVVRKTITEHLAACGSWRREAFDALARELTGGEGVLQTARWCHETCYAVRKDGAEGRFLDAWGRAADFMQALGVFSGEGGVMGLAAACAGWTPDEEALAAMGASVWHEGGGPKDA